MKKKALKLFKNPFNIETNKASEIVKISGKLVFYVLCFAAHFLFKIWINDPLQQSKSSEFNLRKLRRKKLLSPTNMLPYTWTKLPASCSVWVASPWQNWKAGGEGIFLLKCTHDDLRNKNQLFKFMFAATWLSANTHRAGRLSGCRFLSKLCIKLNLFILSNFHYPLSNSPSAVGAVPSWFELSTMESAGCWFAEAVERWSASMLFQSGCFVAGSLAGWRSTRCWATAGERQLARDCWTLSVALLVGKPRRQGSALCGRDNSSAKKSKKLLNFN